MNRDFRTVPLSLLSLCAALLTSGCGASSETSQAAEVTASSEPTRAQAHSPDQTQSPAPDQNSEPDSQDRVAKAAARIPLPALIAAIRTPIDLHIPRTEPVGPVRPWTYPALGPDGPVHFVQAYAARADNQPPSLQHLTAWQTGATDVAGLVTVVGGTTLTVTSQGWTATPGQLSASWEIPRGFAPDRILRGPVVPNNSGGPAESGTLMDLRQAAWPHTGLRLTVEMDPNWPGSWKLCTLASTAMFSPPGAGPFYFASSCGVFNMQGILEGATAFNQTTLVHHTGNRSAFSCRLVAASAGSPQAPAHPACIRANG